MNTLVKGGEEFIQGNDKIQIKKSKDNRKNILCSYKTNVAKIYGQYSSQSINPVKFTSK